MRVVIAVKLHHQLPLQIQSPTANPSNLSQNDSACLSKRSSNA